MSEQATIPMQATRDVEIREKSPATDLLTNMFPVCPTCKHPYAASFQGYEYILTGRAVCSGSLALQFCKPVLYHVFPLPLTSLSMDIELNGKRYRGVLYEAQKEGES